MDKTSSFRCVKFALVAGNATVILLGLAGFLLGLIDPPFLQMYDPSTEGLFPLDYGPSLALISCIAVVIATGGLIGALREHTILLLFYSLCLIGVFIFRITWWATSQLHQGKRFILDLTVSSTLLFSLVKFFLLIFAILEALTIQNSLPLTKKKFLLLRSKLIKGNSTNLVKTSGGKLKKPQKPLPPDNIYITPSSIYGSGRRRSPVRVNGHGDSQLNQHHLNVSQRAKKYLPGVGLSSSSPNSSGSSHDSNNNKNSTVNTLQNVSIQTKSDTPLVIDTVDSQEHRVPKNLSHEHYFRYQSPSPSTPTAPKQIFSKAANPPLFNPQVSSHRVSSPRPLSNGKSDPRSVLSSTNKFNSLPPASRVTPTPAPRLSPLYSRSSTLLTTTRPPSLAQSRPTYTTSVTNPRSSILDNSTMTSVSSPKTSITSAQVPSSMVDKSSSKIYGRDQMPKQRASFFTSPPTSYITSNLFNYSSPLSTSSTSSPNTTVTVGATPLNLNQTRNLFSTYTSPLTSQLASSQSGLVPGSTSVASPSSYRSTLLSKAINSPSPTNRVTKTLHTGTSANQMPMASTPNYMQLSLPQTRAITTVSNSTGVYKSLFSPSPKSTATVSAVSPNHQNTATTASPSSSSVFSGNYPKSYEDYVKSYRYPTDYSTVKAARATSPPLLVSPTPARQLQPISDRTADSSDFETTTYMSTTTQHRQMIQTQKTKESLYFREIVREG